MSVSPGQYRLLPGYGVLKHRYNPSHGILDIRDFFSTCPTSLLENKDAEHYKVLTYQFPPRADNVKLRWIVLENNSPETLKYLASELLPMSSLGPSDRLEKSFFKRSYLRFGLFRYSQAYAESRCEKISLETGYSPSGSAKLDPQLAIHLPYFKWGPTTGAFEEMYPSLRDYAQPSVFYRQLENETEKAGTQGVLPIVVHQLWLFVTNSSTVVSFHPQTSAQSGNQLDVDLDAVVMMDIPGVISKDAKDGDPLEDAYVMAAYFVRKACLLQISGSSVETPMIPFLEQKVALLSGKRIDAYTSFSASIAKGEGSHQHGSKGRQTEIELLLEIIMTIEELESFLFVIENQTTVVLQMQSACSEIGNERTVSQAAHALLARTMVELSGITADVKRLVKNATQIQAAMVQLLDLKQKEANLLEAQYARQRAEEAAIQTRETAQQGRTLLLFTVTTIMFLPLSFFTSYFGMNVQEITGDDQNTTQHMFWSVCAPITVTIVTVAVLIAFNESVRESIQRFRIRWSR